MRKRPRSDALDKRIAVGECVEDSTTDPQHPAADEPLASPRGTP
jgi:hypothetical protein